MCYEPDARPPYPPISGGAADGKDIVFVVQSGRVDRRAVTVIETQGDDSVLSAGVATGEQVILKAPASLQDGAAVKVKSL